MIKDREKHEQKTETRFVSIDKAELVGAEARDRAAQLTVRFVSQMISVTRDKTGAIVDGNPDKVADITDVWTFARDTSFSRSELEAGWHRKRGLDATPCGFAFGVIAVGVVRWLRWMRLRRVMRVRKSLRIRRPHPRHLPYPELECRFRSTAANMRRSPGPISRAGARTIISPPTRRFA